MVSAMMIAALMAGSVMAAGGDGPVGNFYVAPGGSDANPGTVDAPFATVAHAQAAVRALKAQDPARDVLVLLRGGEYLLDAALVFGVEDGGDAEHTVTYAAYPGEEPVLSGGRPITGWQAGDGGVWTARIPETADGKWPFRQLFADGQRLTRGRFPNAPELLHVQGVNPEVTQITLDQIPEAVLGGRAIELVMYQNWSISRSLITAAEGTTLTLANPMGWIGHGDATTASPGKPCIIENAAEFIDQPGEWYLDYETGVLTYRAAEGEDPNARQFVAPKLEQLILIGGRPGEPVRNLRFEGIAFAYTEWPLPARGYNGIQAGHHGTRMEEPSSVLPLAIEVLYAEGCAFDRCRIAHTGACAIGFGQQCRNNRVAGCEIHDIGGNGVMVGWRGKGNVTGRDQAGNHHLSGDWIEPADVPFGNAIIGCAISECGAINHGCVGVFDAFSAETRIAHNHIHNMPYTGISIGFRWDESETSQRGTIVEYNHVHDTMIMLADGGCIYTLGWQPGTVIRGNVLHDAHRSAFAHGGAPNNGIFFDQGSKGYLVTSNTIYNTSGRPIRFNQTGAENMTWESNAFGVGASSESDPVTAARW